MSAAEQTLTANTVALLKAIQRGSCFKKQIQIVECLIGDNAALKVHKTTTGTIVYLKQKNITHMVNPVALWDKIVAMHQEQEVATKDPEAQNLIDDVLKTDERKADLREMDKMDEDLLRQAAIREALEEDFRMQQEARASSMYFTGVAPVK